MSTVLETVQVPIDEIHPHPSNPRVGNLDVIKESLEEHGQYRAIVVDRETNDILAGNHTWRAAKELGWESVLTHWVTATPEGAKKLLLIDNRASDMAGYDPEKQMELLEGLMLTGQLRGTGYTAEDVDDLGAGLDRVAELTPAFEGDYRETPEDTASRYREPGAVVPQRQFVLMYPEGPEAEEVEANVRKLKRDWGVPGMREVVAEALRRVVRFEDAADADAAADDSAEAAENEN